MKLGNMNYTTRIGENGKISVNKRRYEVSMFKMLLLMEEKGINFLI